MTKFRVSATMTLLAMLLLALDGVHADEHCDFADETILIGGVVPLSAPGSVA